MNAKGRVWFVSQTKTRPTGPFLPLREAVNLKLTLAGMRPSFEDCEAILREPDGSVRATAALSKRDMPLSANCRLQSFDGSLTIRQ